MGSPGGLSTVGKIMKIIFILLNLLYLGIGIALIAVGSWLAATHNDFSAFTGSSYFSGAVLLIVAGVVVFFVTLVGIAGAFFQHKYILGAYVVVVVIIIILEIAATIVGFVFRDTISDKATDNAVDAVGKYYANEDDENYDESIIKAIDFVQETFECCGWGTYMIWEDSPYFNETMMYPESCVCKNGTEKECIMVLDFQEIYNDTCDADLSDRLRRNVAVVGGVGVAFAIAQVIPVLLAIYLVYAIHKLSEYVTV